MLFGGSGQGAGGRCSSADCSGALKRSISRIQSAMSREMLLRSVLATASQSSLSGVSREALPEVT